MKTQDQKWLKKLSQAMNDDDGEDLAEEMNQCLDEVGVWLEMYDESRTLVHTDDYPGFSIGLGLK